MVKMNDLYAQQTYAHDTLLFMHFKMWNDKNGNQAIIRTQKERKMGEEKRAKNAALNVEEK